MASAYVIEKLLGVDVVKGILMFTEEEIALTEIEILLRIDSYE